MNEVKAKLTEDEYQLLKLEPRFIYNDPKAASKRRTTELAVLKRKIATRFFEKKFVIQNNYFSYNGKYYHQVRGGAMGSPLTLTIANSQIDHPES
ncbi:unnamed protein product [Rotaria magnacalcarata]|uniref:Uncharacterized protein n=1 Tax=Rotaria magnacalcarata TaxID=392030 RepID=A0A815IYQ0_9BILA|nr:unnamed protein product [Rotaria magnacalcarata]